MRRSLVAVGGKALREEPKTAASVRTVALPARAVEALRAQRRAQAADKAAALAAGSAYADEGFVFATGDGRALWPTNASRDFRRARDLTPCPGCGRPTSPEKDGSTAYRCRQCKRHWEGGTLPRLPFHALRHTAVSIQLADVVPLEIVSKRIGHKR